MNPKYSPSGTPITTPIKASSTRPVDAGELRPMSSAQATLSSAPPPIRPFPGRPVRRMGMIVDDNTLDIPAYKRRGDTPALDEKLEPERLADPEDKLDVPTFLRKHLD